MAVQSPCVAVCALDADDVCLGCGRTASEIAQYAAASDDERNRINERARDRLEVID